MLPVQIKHKKRENEAYAYHEWGEACNVDCGLWNNRFASMLHQKTFYTLEKMVDVTQILSYMA